MRGALVLVAVLALGCVGQTSGPDLREPPAATLSASAARDAPRMATKICNPCAAAATTTYAGVKVNGGYSIAQVTCSAADGNTWPDAFDLEARDGDDHTWVSVQGFTTAVADGREANLLGFSEGSSVRAVITDAAGQHSCYATISAFGD